MKWLNLKGESHTPAIVSAAVALVLRVSYLITSWKYDPLAGDLVLDSKIYIEWAKAILSHSTLPPTSLMQAPLYPWFIAALYKITGAHIYGIKAAQVLLGTISCALVASFTAKVFKSRTAGLIAGLLLAIYKPLIFYTGVIIPATLVIFLISLSVWLLYAGETEKGGTGGTGNKREKGGKAVLLPLSAGAILGLAAVAKPTALLLAPFGLMHLYYSQNSRPNTAEKNAGKRMVIKRKLFPFLIGLLLTITPLTIRNYIASGDFIPLTTGGGINFYIGHNPSANGFYSVPTFRGKPLGATPEEQWKNMHSIAAGIKGTGLTPSGVSNFWLTEGVRFIRKHPTSEALLLWKKFLFFLNDYERANVENLYFHSRFPGVLRLPLPGFGILAPLALAGIFLTLRLKRKLILLYGGVFSYLLSALVFYVLSRYRLPVVIFLSPFAGAFIVESAGIIKKHRYSTLLLLAIALPALFNLSNMKIAEDSGSSISNNLVRLGRAYIEKGDLEKALGAFREALEKDPTNRTAAEGINIIRRKRNVERRSRNGCAPASKREKPATGTGERRANESS